MHALDARAHFDASARRTWPEATAIAQRSAEVVALRAPPCYRYFANPAREAALDDKRWKSGAPPVQAMLRALEVSNLV